jgi:hypothetical protein
MYYCTDARDGPNIRADYPQSHFFSMKEKFYSVKEKPLAFNLGSRRQDSRLPRMIRLLPETANGRPPHRASPPFLAGTILYLGFPLVTELAGELPVGALDQNSSGQRPKRTLGLTRKSRMSPFPFRLVAD